MAELVSITHQPLDQEYDERLDYFIRVPQQAAQLVANHGLADDRKAGHNPRRQVNLLSQEWLDGLAPQGFKTAPGSFGEQLIVTGLDFSTIARGDRLFFDGTACLEITGPREGCVRLDLAQGRETAVHAGPIGLLARVIMGGPIRVGSTVTLQKAELVQTAGIQSS